MEAFNEGRKGRILARWLRNRRTYRGLSQEELAHKVKVSTSVIQRIEDNTRTLDVIEYLDLCAALDISPHNGIESVIRDKLIAGKWS